MKTKDIKKKYFRFLDIGNDYSHKKISCKICGSQKK